MTSATVTYPLTSATWVHPVLRCSRIDIARTDHHGGLWRHGVCGLDDHVHDPLPTRFASPQWPGGAQ